MTPSQTTPSQTQPSHFLEDHGASAPTRRRWPRLASLGPWLRARRVELAALAVITLFFTLFFWPALFGGRFLISGDSLVYSYSLRMIAWDMIRQGTLPLWTPLVFSGYPLLSMAQLGIGYPLTWGYLFLPGHWAEQIYILAPYLLAPAFTYAYARQIGRSPLAALLAGLSFGYGGLVFSPIGLNGMLPNSVLWLPLVLIAVERARTKRFASCVLLAAGAYALAVLAGIGQGFVYAGILALAYAVFVAVFLPAESEGTKMGWLAWARWRPLAVCVGGIALGAGVAAFQVLETERAAGRSVRAVLSFAQFSDGPFTFTLAWKSWLDSMHHLGDVTTYVPPLTVALAIVAVVAAVRWPRDRRVLFWLAVAVVAWVLMLGANTPLHRWVYHIPIINRFRMPSRHAFEWTFALSVLAAYGWDRLAALIGAARTGVSTRLRLPSVLPILMAAAALVLAIFVGWRWRVATSQPAPDPKLIFGDLDASYLGWKAVFTLLIFVAVVAAWRAAAGRWRWALAAAAIAVGCFAEPSLLFARWSLPFANSASRLARFAPATEFLRQFPPEQNRVYTQVHPFADYSPEPRLDAPNLPALAGLHDVAGYEPLLLERYSRALNSNTWEHVNRSPAIWPDSTLFGAHSHVLDLLNTTFVTAYQGLNQGPGGLEEKDGIQFSSGSLGLDVSAVAPNSFSTGGAEGDTLALVTTLGVSGHLTDGTPVARIVIRGSDGQVVERELRAGVDTAEWAHERPDVRPTISHSLAPVYDRMSGYEFPAYRYLARLNLGGRLRVERVEIIKLVREAGLGVWKASLFDSTSGRSTPLVAYDPERWQVLPLGAEHPKDTMILRNQRALPRAWLVTEAEALNEQEVWRRIRGLSKHEFDPRRTALVEIEPHKLPQLSGRPLAPDSFARVVNYEPNRLVIETQADQPTMLIVSEQHYPGWVATVDGVKAPIHTTDFLLRGVVLTAGAHRVEMRYRAPAARNGAIISLLSLLALAGLAVYAKRQAAGYDPAHRIRPALLAGQRLLARVVAWARTNMPRAAAWARTSDAAIVLGLALICLVTRLLAVPASLWEWDDILFARALHRYDLVAHSPHPPGFPVFVALARVFFWVLKDEHRALVGVALVFGVLLGPALFYFYREIFRERGLAVAGALLGSFAPNVWVQGAAGRSDGPGLTLGIIALALALRGLQSRTALLIGCAVFGLGMGVRVTLLPIVAPTLAVVLLVRLWRREWKLVAAAIAVAGLAALCWYVPLIVHTTWRVYRSVLNQHAEFTWTTDSIFAPTENSILSYRLTRFFVDIWGAPWVMWTIYVLAVLGVAALAWQKRWRVLGWLTLAFLPFVAFVFILNTPLSAPLYSLPYVPFFTGLAACGLMLTPRLLSEWMGQPVLRRLGPVLVLGLTIALAEWTYPIFQMWRREASPPNRALRQLQSRLDTQRDVVVYEGLYAPHIDLYLPKQRALMGQEELMPEANLIELMIERPPLVGITTVPVLGVAGQRFAWTNKRGERRLRTLSLGRYLDAYITSVTSTRGVQFLSGWYDEEQGNERAWRWMSGRGRAALLNGAETMMLRVRGVTVTKPGSDRRPTIVLRLDGVEVDRFSPGVNEFDRTLTVKADLARLWSVLDVETDLTVIPKRDAGIDDGRELGLQCFGLEWWPAPGAAAALRAPNQFLGAGWHELERDRNDVWRWTSSVATAQLPPLASDARLELRLLAPTGSDGQRSAVTIEVAGQIIERFEPPHGWCVKTYTVPAALHRGAPAELKITAQPRATAAEQRPLGLQVYYLGWRPAEQP